MKEEIAAAVFFVARLVKRYGCLDNDSREHFAAALTSVLFENYKNHWHPNAPTKGQAYRSVKLFVFPIDKKNIMQLNKQNKTNLDVNSS